MSKTVQKDNTDILNGHWPAGPKIYWETDLMGMRLLVMVKRINGVKDMVDVSIECPFFNVKRERVEVKPVLAELEKVVNFLRQDGGTT